MPYKRKRKRRILLTAVLLVLSAIAGFMIYFSIIAIDHPPEVEDKSSLQMAREEIGHNAYRFGNSWMRKSKSGLWEVYLQGRPFERGVAFGKLTRELLYYQETAFVEQIKELVPSDGYLKVLKYFIAFFNRNLDKHITDEYKEEIYGTSFACSKEYSFIGSGYQRQLNYHAAHDIGHALQGLNLVACTSFSVWDARSSDSALLIGRNFDFYMGDKFAENKIVCFVNPSAGYKFMMITWADLIGVVSGMNEKGLTVTLNASKSTIPTQAATPVTLLAREILQYASNIREAYDIAKKRKLFVSESIMIGSAMDNMTAIIEKSPDQDDLVFPHADQIICTNHFQGKTFESDEINQENIRGSDSFERYKRLDELLNRKRRITATDMAGILRDQRVLGDSDAGMGNQLAINQLIAHHSVVFKPGSLMVWVSASPWQLGEYVAYDLNKVFKLNAGSVSPDQEICHTALNIPADTFLQTPDYHKYLQYRLMSRQIRDYKENRTVLPEMFEQHYILQNPGLYLTYVNLGDYYNEMNDYSKAHRYYLQALGKKLPGNDVKEKLTETSETLRKKVDHDHSQN